ncbi:hypothetical protein CYMTET_31145 [Cymbomonas tetramitiformis]|uniref:Ankyrin repeat domain-containing protein n=1 Tax=Cymbomonas tetramitiformis TaxID=36881 RepID=A0AAE0FHQ7_9CHLO|nr:hypothetical protein CYMTET_31145 [Cymbomonas tetramitiformis]
MKIVSCDEETLFELIAANKASDVELMLESGIVSVDCEFDGKTPLVAAVELGLGKMVMLLLNAGADPTRRDAQGRCPVQLASDQESLWSFFGGQAGTMLGRTRIEEVNTFLDDVHLLKRRAQHGNA